ncbi:MAG: acyl-CoA thioesterase [Polyangiaceae bacterium]
MTSDSSLSLVEFRPRFCETDLMGVVHHSNHLVYFEAARVEWLRRRGVSFAAWTERGLHFPVVEVSVAYKGAAFFDDALVIEIRLAELRAASARFSYRMRRGDTLLAEAMTRLAFIDAARRPIRIPPDVLETLSSPEIA